MTKRAKSANQRFWETARFVAIATLLSNLVTTLSVVLGADREVAAMVGVSCIGVYAVTDMAFGTILPHRRCMKRYARINQIMNSDRQNKWLEATYLLGLNRVAFDGDRKLLEFALRRLLEKGIDPYSIDKGRT